MRTTKADFALYKREVLRLIDEWNIGGWEVHFEHIDLGEYRAQLETLLCDHIAIFRLTTTWDSSIIPLTADEIKGNAKHEVIHLLTRGLYTKGKDRFVSIDDLDREEEHLVRFLEKIIP